MARTAKLAVAAALGGLLLSLAFVSAAQPPAVRLIDQDMVEIDQAPTVSGSESRRCRTLTQPDAACEALWEAQRRRFFHAED